ncbi:MAG: hypothetical protein AB8B68_02080 [Rickettsiaceae bacterium]
MYLTNENLTFVKKNESLFVSLKYLDLQGNLNQLDSSSKNILADSNNHGFEVSKNICLLPISSKGFCDPFRALPTTSFLCDNIADDLDIREYSNKLVYDLSVNMVTAFEAEMTFWIDNTIKEDLFWKIDPFDHYSNLRSDILERLEQIDIKMPGNKKGECIIGFKGNNIIDLADNFILTKFIINNVAANYGQKVIFNQDKAQNLKLILLCNDNDGQVFLNNFIANHSLVLEYSSLLQMNNLDSKSSSKRKLFNDDCKLEVNLTTSNIFNPYINFAFVMLYFLKNEEILEKIEGECVKFIKNYKKKILKK